MVGMGGYQTGEQDGQVSCRGGDIALRRGVERGEGSADCSLKNLAIMLMLKQIGQFALFWS